VVAERAADRLFHTSGSCTVADVASCAATAVTGVAFGIAVGRSTSRTKRLGFGSRPSFSPDGRRLLFGCSDKSGESICVARLGSGRASHLTSGAFDYDPDWQREPVDGRG
jgi:hypothetical protein